MGEPIKDGGAAFAALTATGLGDVHHQPGMSLRDYFAAKALTGLLAYPEAHLNCGTASKAATAAFEIADAMLKAREVQP